MGEQITAEINKSKGVDPFLAAIRQIIVDTQIMPGSGADLSDFTAGAVVVLPPEAEEKEIQAEVDVALAKSKGLALLIVGGDASNPDKEAPGPRCTIELEMQLFVHEKLRKKGSRTPLELVVALMKGLHDAQIRVTGFPWYDEVRWLTYGPLADDDFVAYTLTFEREMSV